MHFRFGKDVAPASSNVTNLSARVLDGTELFILSHGLKFSLPPKLLRKEEVHAEFEVLMAQLNHHKPVSTDKKQELKARLVDLAYGYCGTPIEYSDWKMVAKCRDALTRLKRDDTIKILKPDKGSGVVILNTTDYISKMDLILNDSTKFVKLGPAQSEDNTETIEDDIRTFICKLLECKQISKEVHELIRPMGSIRPRLYGLPKTHKNGVPLRPILSMIKSAQHKLAQWLNVVLEPVLETFSSYCVKDSFSFANLIREKNDTKGLMCSFDVKSLFTNVPLDETIGICADALYDGGNNTSSLDKDNFVKLMKLATSGVEFSFNNIMYRQVDGVAMGSPLGPSLANIFVGYQEQRLFANYRRPPVYLRYVDDTFVILKNEKERRRFHQLLNDLHPSLSFTCESEKNDQLPFLDVMVERKTGRFLTSVYRKPTFTGLYTRWNSHCEKRRKTNLAKTLVHRARMICSPEKLPGELEFIRSTLISNGYPERVIVNATKAITDGEDQGHRTVTSSDEEEEIKLVYIRLPYIGSPSTRYAGLIKEAIRNCYRGVLPRVIFKSRGILPAAQKDVLPILSNSDVIYQYTCHCDSRYVGRTSQRLQARVTQHIPKYITNLSASLEGRKPSSSIAKHLVDHPECRKHYNDGQFTIINRGRSEFHLSVLEAVEITSRKPSICKQRKFKSYTTLLFK